MGKSIESTFEIKNHYLKLVNDIKYDQLELLLEDVTFFEIIGASKAEIRHSNFLAWLLDPNASHGLGESILKRFLRQLFADDRALGISEIEVESLNYHKVNILREWQNIDLLIEFDDLVIALENKLYSKEHSNQLTRYYNIVEKEFPNRKRVYGFLTPEGSEAMDESQTYVSISYFEVAEIIDRIISVRGGSLGENTKVYINDYLKTLKRQVMETDSSIELARDIYRSHKEILDFIFEHKPDEKAPVVAVFTEVLKEKGYAVVSSSKSYLRFTTPELAELLPSYQIQKSGWPGKEPFSFELGFSHSKRITLAAVISPHGISDTLKDLLLKVDGASPPSGKIWYTFFHKKMPIKYDSDELENEEKFKAKVEKFISDFEGKIDDVQNIFLKNSQEIKNAYNNN